MAQSSLDSFDSTNTNEKRDKNNQTYLNQSRHHNDRLDEVTTSDMTIRERVLKMINFIEKYRKWTEFYAIDYFIQDFDWPEHWSVLTRLDTSALGKIVNQGYTCPDWPPDLIEFIQMAHELALVRDSSTEEMVLNKYAAIGMSDKKKSEIQSLALAIHQQAQKMGIKHILDLGCGQGYLSSVLALDFGYYVVGWDSDAQQIQSAQKRLDHIRSLYLKSVHRNSSRVDVRQEEGIGQISFEESEIQGKDIRILYEKLIKKHPPAKWMLIGLHCCGDLSPNLIRAFCQSDGFSAMVNLGCCYQKLSEPYSHSIEVHFRSRQIVSRLPTIEDSVVFDNHVSSSKPFESNQELCGFPMSKTVKSLDFVLGPHCTMVACQAAHRWGTFVSDIDESLKRLFYRGVFETIHLTLTGHRIKRPLKKLGAEAYRSPLGYTRAALMRIGYDGPIDEEWIQEQFVIDQDKKSRLAAIWMCRSILAQVVESLILLDRYLFVKERNIDVDLVAMCDPAISPRNMSLVCSKSDTSSSGFTFKRR